ncbi:hypothetical protein ABTZ03_39180 [Kitasatospora sp. NPDC096077]|uniref:hypothetical protein n=1 Tax=Kitasatospora sp. NPDC096077 TaxID=3155544 RepID=UPI003323AAF0
MNANQPPNRRPLPDPGVSSRAAAALTEAMHRLLNGRPQHTDGRLTKENLYREAGVSRATMNRSKTVLAAWDAAVAARAEPQPATSTDDIAGLRARLADKTRECTRLRNQLDAATTAIAALHHDTTALREQARLARTTVTALTTPQPEVGPRPGSEGS